MYDPTFLFEHVFQCKRQLFNDPLCLFLFQMFPPDQIFGELRSSAILKYEADFMVN